MKNSRTRLFTGVVWVNFLSASCNGINHNTSVVIHDTPKQYSFDAHYDKSRTEAVYRYLDSCFAPEKVVGKDVVIAGQIILKDNTAFEIDASAGILHIQIDKSRNSISSISRLKKICSGIKITKGR